MWVVALLTLLAFTISGCLSQCSIPLKPDGYNQDVDRAVGIWYEFMYRNGPVGKDPSGVNSYTNATIQGIYPGIRNTKYFTWYYNFYYRLPTDAAGGSLHCGGRYVQGNISSFPAQRVVDATHIGYNYAPGKTILTMTTLFTDYNLVQILYRCNTENADGVHCDEPHFWVYSRIKPPMLTQIQKNYIKSVADYYLAPMCRTSKDLDPTTWNLAVVDPPCNAGAGYPPWPTDWAAILRAHGVAAK